MQSIYHLDTSVWLLIGNNFTKCIYVSWSVCDMSGVESTLMKNTWIFECYWWFLKKTELTHHKLLWKDMTVSPCLHFQNVRYALSWMGRTDWSILSTPNNCHYWVCQMCVCPLKASPRSDKNLTVATIRLSTSVQSWHSVLNRWHPSKSKHEHTLTMGLRTFVLHNSLSCIFPVIETLAGKLCGSMLTVKQSAHKAERTSSGWRV